MAKDAAFLYQKIRTLNYFYTAVSHIDKDTVFDYITTRSAINLVL